MENIRQTMLFIPGNSPGMIQNGPVFNSDSIIFDLEDAVSLNQKDAARILLKHALKNVDFGNTEIVVRINDLNSDLLEDDLESIVQPQLNSVLIPKIKGPDDIKKIEEMLSQIEQINNRENKVEIIALVETAIGVENAFNIAEASDRLSAILFGGEDFTADIRTTRTKEGEEIAYARSRIVVACRAAGISIIDTPFSDIEDIEGLKKDAKIAKKLGFDGKAVISPLHIDIVNQIFKPDQEEIQWAQRVIRAIERSEREGKGVISLDGKMIDAPVVKRAKRVMKIAEKKEGAI